MSEKKTATEKICPIYKAAAIMAGLDQYFDSREDERAKILCDGEECNMWASFKKGCGITR